MGGRLVIRGGLAVAGAAPEPATVVVEGARIAAVVPAGERVPARPDDWEIDAAGRLVVPGAIDPHTHLALGGLARSAGLPGRAPAVHDRWRAILAGGLEPRADPEVVEALAAAGAVVALRAGVTTAFEFLRAAPGRAGESLAAAARGVEEIGLRAVIAYGASDRAGAGEGLREAAAADAFAAARAAHPTVRGAAGLDGLDATPEELLAALAGPAGRHGLLASIGEDDTDLTAAYFRASRRPVELLFEHGLLGPRTVIAHGSTVASEEGLRLAAAGATLAATPRAASFWGTPIPPLAELAALGVSVAVGTDGLFPDVPCELVAASLFHRAAARSPRAGADLAGGVLWPAAARLASGWFGAPLGALAPGALADVVIVDWRPAVPLPPIPGGDLALLWAGAPAAWAIVGGEVRLREGRILGVDEVAVAERARRAAARVLG